MLFYPSSQLFRLPVSVRKWDLTQPNRRQNVLHNGSTDWNTQLPVQTKLPRLQPITEIACGTVPPSFNTCVLGNGQGWITGDTADSSTWHKRWEQSLWWVSQAPGQRRVAYHRSPTKCTSFASVFLCLCLRLWYQYVTVGTDGWISRWGESIFLFTSSNLNSLLIASRSRWYKLLDANLISFTKKAEKYALDFTRPKL